MRHAHIALVTQEVFVPRGWISATAAKKTRPCYQSKGAFQTNKSLKIIPNDNKIDEDV
jgi:hypothetical protein